MKEEGEGSAGLVHQPRTCQWPEGGSRGHVVVGKAPNPWLLPRSRPWSELGVKGLEYMKEMHTAFEIRRILKNDQVF